MEPITTQPLFKMPQCSPKDRPMTSKDIGLPHEQDSETEEPPITTQPLQPDELLPIDLSNISVCTADLQSSFSVNFSDFETADSESFISVGMSSQLTSETKLCMSLSLASVNQERHIELPNQPTQIYQHQSSCPQIPLFNLHRSQNILLPQPSMTNWNQTWNSNHPQSYLQLLYDQELPIYSVDSHQLTCLPSSPQLQSVDKLLVYNQHIVLDKQQTILSQMQLASEQSLPLDQQTQPNTELLLDKPVVTSETQVTEMQSEIDHRLLVASAAVYQQSIMEQSTFGLATTVSYETITE